MPQLITLALAGIGVWAIYKWLKKQAAEAAKDAVKQAQMTEKNAVASPKSQVQDLEPDPKTGVFKSKE
ncbi:MAG: hypothetical protein AAF228_05260 [Pseudomonadota bacterium]